MKDKGDDIKRYKDGTMTVAERHAMEKKALTDPFLADALEGAEVVSADEFSADLNAISKQIERGHSRIPFTPLRIAATVILLISAASLVYYFNPSGPGPMAEEKASAPAGQADSATLSQTVRTDSTSGLLSMNKPEEPKNTGKPSTQPIPKQLAKADRTLGPDTTHLAGGAGAVMTEGDVSKVEKAEEREKTKITIAELGDDKTNKVTQPIESLSSAGAGGENKKESQVSRRSTGADNLVLGTTTQNISGKVVSAEDGSVLPGVNVQVKGTKENTFTDEHGNYQLTTTQSNPQLIFSFIGMVPQEANAKDKSVLDMKMKEDESQVSEVVVTEVRTGTGPGGESKSPRVKLAVPTGGMRGYNKYLETNLRYPREALEKKIRGKVIVRFTVTATGGLTELNTTKALGYGCDEEVIRLIQEGPKWIPSTVDNLPVDSEVKVRILFNPEKVKR